MATSGVYILTTTADEVIQEAFDLLQIGTDGETLQGEDTQRAIRTLNFMLKKWDQAGHLWAEEEGTLFLVQGQAEYDFATANLANVWFETTLSADEAAAQAVLSVTDTTDINIADIIGIVLDDLTTHWTTVVSKTATEVTITVAIPSAAVSGSFVRTYAPSSFAPVNRIFETRRRERAEYEIDMNFESRKDYMHLPDKVNTGQPIQSYFSRQRPSGRMFLWPPPNDTKIAINFTYERPIQIVSAGTENLDVPDYWFEAVIYGLAFRLIPKFGCTEGRAAIITAGASNSFDDALEYDSELYPIEMDMSEHA